MATRPFVLAVDFPRAVRGYAPMAVDDFVRQIGGRLEALQSQIDEQASRADRLQRELQAANRNLAAYVGRETAIANALVATEQRRVTVDQQIELDRMNAQVECDRVRSDAQQEAAAVLADALTEANEVRASARVDAERVTADAAAVAEALKTATAERCAAMSGNSRAQADAILNEAQVSAEAIVAEARRVAQETADGMARDLEVRGAQLQALCLAYDETAARVRRVLEAQLSLLPSPGMALESLSLGDVAVTMSSARDAVPEAA
ncbi:MAG TPA: DivIVA domain-containing protein [Chthonomonadales bacterium]|nr:DivIVA domain-containing protein [Chthonomonadales bacterium]